MKKEKETQKGKGEYMKAFLILEDGTVFTGTSIGSTRDMISEIVFNTSMTGYQCIKNLVCSGVVRIIADHGVTQHMIVFKFFSP